MTDIGAAAKAMSESLRRGATAPQSAAPVAPQPGAPGDRRNIGSSIAKYPDEPLPDLTDPAVSPFDKGAELSRPRHVAPVGDETAWRIARACASKQVNIAIGNMGGLDALTVAWNDENRPATVGLINSIAKAIVTGE